MASSRVVHWPTINGNWATALTLFAQTPQPSSLPAGVYLRSDEHTLTIFDGYPKAKFHFLVLPRIPFKLPPGEASNGSPAQLSLAGNGKLSLGRSATQSQVPASHLGSLNALLASPYAAQVLSRLHKASEQVVSLIKEEMRATRTSLVDGPCGVEWGVRVGFHAVPSMEIVHVHVISDDLVSERLKNKKHYQSFRPKHGFWLDLAEVQELVQGGKKGLPQPARYYEGLLKAPLVSFRDQQEYRNMVELKSHLGRAWLAELRAKIESNGAGQKKRRGAGDEEHKPPKSQRTIETDGGTDG